MTTVLLLVLVATRVPDLVLNSTTDVTQSGGNALLQVTLAAGIGPLTFSMLTVTVECENLSTCIQIREMWFVDCSCIQMSTYDVYS